MAVWQWEMCQVVLQSAGKLMNTLYKPSEDKFHKVLGHGGQGDMRRGF